MRPLGSRLSEAKFRVPRAARHDPRELMAAAHAQPPQVSEYLAASNVGIKGVIPGEPTERHIEAQLMRCKFWVRGARARLVTVVRAARSNKAATRACTVHARHPCAVCHHDMIHALPAPCKPRRPHSFSQGGAALGTLAVCAQLFDMACQRVLGASLSATSLLIIVGTVMQSSRQVRARARSTGGAARPHAHNSMDANTMGRKASWNAL